MELVRNNALSAKMSISNEAVMMHMSKRETARKTQNGNKSTKEGTPTPSPKETVGDTKTAPTSDGANMNMNPMVQTSPDNNNQKSKHAKIAQNFVNRIENNERTIRELKQLIEDINSRINLLEKEMEGKEDIIQVLTKLKEDVKKIETNNDEAHNSFRGDIAEINGELSKQKEELQTDLLQIIEKLEQDFKTDIQKLNVSVETVSQTHTAFYESLKNSVQEERQQILGDMHTTKNITEKSLQDL